MLQHYFILRFLSCSNIVILKLNRILLFFKAKLFNQIGILIIFIHNSTWRRICSNELLQQVIFLLKHVLVVVIANQIVWDFSSVHICIQLWLFWAASFNLIVFFRIQISDLIKILSCYVIKIQLMILNFYKMLALIFYKAIVFLRNKGIAFIYFFLNRLNL